MIRRKVAVVEVMFLVLIVRVLLYWYLIKTGIFCSRHYDNTVEQLSVQLALPDVSISLEYLLKR